MELYEFDIVIVGGGSSGIAAAIGASQKGYRVALIERLSFLGGKATAAEVGTICGLYQFSKNPNSEFIVKGFAKYFSECLQKRSGLNPLHNILGLHYLPYHIEDYKQLCEELITDKQIDCFFNCEVTAVGIGDGKLKHVIGQQLNKTIQLNCETVVDCSGNAIINQLAHFSLIKKDTYQAAAQIFTINGIEDIQESALGLALMRDVQKAISGKKLDTTFDRVSIVQGSIHNHRVSLKIGLPIAVTYKENNLQELKLKAHEMIHALINYLKENSSTFKNISLDHIAPELGNRVGVRPVGKYILKESDVLSGKKFDTAIANCSWPVEEWGLDKRVQMRYFEYDDFYQIPVECLISNECDNLFFGGRNISADDGAIASARVMGICFQTGFAAGRLAVNFITQKPLADCVLAIQQEQIF